MKRPHLRSIGPCCKAMSTPSYAVCVLRSPPVQKASARQAGVSLGEVSCARGGVEDGDATDEGAARAGGLRGCGADGGGGVRTNRIDADGAHRGAKRSGAVRHPAWGGRGAGSGACTGSCPSATTVTGADARAGTGARARARSHTACSPGDGAGRSDDQSQPGAVQRAADHRHRQLRDPPQHVVLRPGGAGSWRRCCYHYGARRLLRRRRDVAHQPVAAYRGEPVDDAAHPVVQFGGDGAHSPDQPQWH
jgi:hypothetical protein